MPVTPAKAPTTVSNRNIGGVDWVSIDNVKVNDTAYSTVTMPSGQTSNTLVINGFGFDLGAGVISIDGVEVTSESTQIGSGGGTFQLTKNGTTGTGSAKSVVITGERTYGGASDLWSASLTAAEVQASTFGVLLGCADSGGGSTGDCEFVTMKIYYTASAGPPPTYTLKAQRRGR